MKLEYTSNKHAITFIKKKVEWDEMLPKVREAFKADDQLQYITIRAKFGISLMYDRDDPAVMPS
jgi:hypothetical protein